ncbi:hypothetical protein GS979_06305 [Rhodococcus hoagii]|nr:hypothetical protein [Prescottella equi]
MTQQMTGVLVVIASPGDTSEERAAVRDQINDWNINNGRRASVAFLPWLYERSAVPSLGGRAQSVINSQAVDRSDIVVAFFDSRLGTSTGVDVSGTAEEIRRAHKLGKPVHVYFSNEPIPRDADLDQQLHFELSVKNLRQKVCSATTTTPRTSQVRSSERSNTTSMRRAGPRPHLGLRRPRGQS